MQTEELNSKLLEENEKLRKLLARKENSNPVTLRDIGK